MSEDNRGYYEVSRPFSEVQEAKHGNNRDHLGRYILGFLILGVVYLLANFCSS